ncbi:hypothetical protein FRC07_007425, partial [Ceratobasidium sp. 392]
MPRDIIALSRSNKFFRNLLMNRSAIHIWHGAMRNIPGLPPCPPDMSEPHYLALIYARNCSMCGVTVSRRMDEMLRVRLCPACRNDSLISISRVSFEIHNLVLSSSKIMPSKRRWDWDSHTFKSDVKEVQARLDEFKAFDDQLGLEKWKETRQEELSARRAQARELIAFLDGVEEDRDAELSGLRHERRQEIHRRLLEHGWEEEDLEFPYYKRRDWDALVEQPKPLTNRIWENLRPKLIPLLEANREDRLKQEKAERMRDCRECLDEYLSGIKNEREPILDVTIRVPVIPVLNAAHTSDSPTSNIEPSTVYIKHIGVFPEIVDALEWDTMQDLLEKDLPAGDMLDLVDAVRPEIVGKIYYWIHNVDTHLAGLLRQGREEDELSAEVPELTLPVVGDSSTDPFEDVTSDQKLLLRADSLFMSNRIGDRQPPLVYDALVAFGYRTQMNLDLSRAWRPSKAPLDLSKFKRHTKAQAVARMLLEHVGKPNATFLEMRTFFLTTTTTATAILLNNPATSHKSVDNEIIMRQTRSSVRLAKAAVKPEPGVSHRSRLDTNPKASLSRVKKEMEPHDTDFEDTKEEDDDFEEHEVPAPKRKRARTARTTKSAPRKRQVRGKQGRLEGLMRMPIDIFAEIALHLMPKDIIMLSRSSKFFRSLLMNRSAIHIWHGSMRNVPGLPPCPPDMSEPRYLTLIYGRNCSMCGGNFNRRMDEILRVRLCPECRNKSLISIAEYPFELHDLVLHSNKIMPSKRRWHLDAHALKSDVDEVQAKIEELRESEDQSALEKWKETRRQELDVRRKQATELIVFLNGIDLDRDAELSGLRRERKAEIHRRLLELGWEKEDLKFPYLRGRDWDTLVEQPRPLTNRTWENLRPKLIPLLEANREDRLKREKEERKRARRGYLSGCLSQIKDEREPLLDLTI